MKINLGILHTLAVRSLQIVAYSAMVLMWLGVPRTLWTIMGLVGLGIAFAWVDYHKIFPQMQEFSLQKNAEFQGLKESIKNGVKS